MLEAVEEEFLYFYCYEWEVYLGFCFLRLFSLHIEVSYFLLLILQLVYIDIYQFTLI